MKGLDVHELEMLSSIARVENRIFYENWISVSNRLISRGLIRAVKQTSDERYAYDWMTITARGRLALACDLAARGITSAL